MLLSELLKTIDIYNVDSKYFEDTLCDNFKNVDFHNYKEFVLEANNQILVLFENENLHAYFIVDWRVNFATLFKFITQQIPDEQRDIPTKKFINYYDDKSANVLYKRLGI